ncbi:MAG: hypothetical protein Tsb0013_04600 [Phycisphaerales bacterium]
MNLSERSVRRGAACVGMMILGLCGTAQAQFLYAADGALSTAGNLYRVDTTTGLATTVGALVDGMQNPYAINGMAWDASTSTLYGTTSGASPTLPAGLVTINPITAQVTPVGALGFMPPNFGAGLDYTGGTLYGWAEGSLSALFTANTASGAGAVVGTNGQGINTTGSGLSTSMAGTTYVTPDGATGNLWQVNLATGQLQAPTPLSGGTPMGRIGALQFESGTLFGAELVGDGVSGITSNRLISINTTTGAITGIGQFRDAATGGFLRNIDALAIPAPGAGAVLGLAALGAVRRRR